MTGRARRNHTPAFKAKVALAAVRGEKTLTELVRPRCDTQALNLHLAEIATQVAPGGHAAALVDQAGWRRSAALNVPPNITRAAASQMPGTQPAGKRRSIHPRKPIRAAAGFTCATTNPLAERGPPAAMFYSSRDRRASIHKRIWRDIPASCKRTPATDTTSSICRGQVLGLSGRRRVGRIPGARSSPWPTSRRTPGAKPPAGRRSLCRRSRARWLVAATRCSRSSDRSTAGASGRTSGSASPRAEP